MLSNLYLNSLTSFIIMGFALNSGMGLQIQGHSNSNIAGHKIGDEFPDEVKSILRNEVWIGSSWRNDIMTYQRIRFDLKDKHFSCHGDSTGTSAYSWYIHKGCQKRANLILSRDPLVSGYFLNSRTRRLLNFRIVLNSLSRVRRLPKESPIYSMIHQLYCARAFRYTEQTKTHVLGPKDRLLAVWCKSRKYPLDSGLWLTGTDVWFLSQDRFGKQLFWYQCSTANSKYVPKYREVNCLTFK